MTTRAETPEGLAKQLLALLDLETLEPDLYRGSCQPGGVGRVFGGQLVAQALRAAQRTVDPSRTAHALHAMFMRPGREGEPILYRVSRDFDGQSFARRHVAAVQGERPILNLSVSFQSPEDGLAHQAPMPAVPMPEALKGPADLAEMPMPERLRDFLRRPRPIEFRPVDPERWLARQAGDPVQFAWVRAVAPLPDDPALHQAILAYASDMLLLGTSLLPHGRRWIDDEVQTASLDHILWLHEPLRADEWLLYSMESLWAGHARGLNRGQLYSRDGRLVASVAQEGLIRVRN